MASGGKNKKQKANQIKLVKRTIKFLASGPDSNVVRTVLGSAPDAVIRGVCNAAVNARQGQVQIHPHLKPLFRHHSKQIDFLIDRQHPIEAKRQLLIGGGGRKRQKGGVFPIVVPLLATVLGSLGTEFISRILRRNDEQ